MYRLRTAGITAAVLLLATLSQAQTFKPTADESTFLKAINAHRVGSHRQTKLTLSPSLTKFARTHAQRMAGGVGLNHSGQTQYGQTESICISSTPEAAAQALLNSTAHHALLTRNFDKVAGVARSGRYWIAVTSWRQTDGAKPVGVY